LRASPRYAALRLAAEPIPSWRMSNIPQNNHASASASFAACGSLLRAEAHHSDLLAPVSFAPFNLHRPGSAATASGFLLAALSNARRNALLTSTFLVKARLR